MPVVGPTPGAARGFVLAPYAFVGMTRATRDFVFDDLPTSSRIHIYIYIYNICTTISVQNARGKQNLKTRTDSRVLDAIGTD